jgi:hypothetical protein
VPSLPGKQLGQCGGSAIPEAWRGRGKTFVCLFPLTCTSLIEPGMSAPISRAMLLSKAAGGPETLGVGNGAVAPVVGGPSLHSAEAVASCHPTALRNPLDSNLDMTPFFDYRQSCENLRGWHRYPKGSDTGRLTSPLSKNRSKSPCGSLPALFMITSWEYCAT